MISLDFGPSLDPKLGDVLKLKIVAGTGGEERDRERIWSIQGRLGRYTRDPLKRIDVLTHWELPAHQIRDIAENWSDTEIITSPVAKQRLDNYNEAKIPIEDLEFLPESEFKLDTFIPLPHQKKLILANRTKKRLLCSWNLGLGKTKGALGRAHVLGFSTLLIVCPNKTMTNWVSEIQEVYGRSSIRFHGTPKQRKALLAEILKSDEHIVVTSFEMVGELKNIEFDQVIIDEAHLVSRLTAQRSQHIKHLIDQNRGSNLTLLTGTPIMHRVPDLWTLIHYLNPDLAGSDVAWIDRYIKNGRLLKRRMPNGKTVLFSPDQAVQNIEELQKRLASIMIRVGYEGITTFKDTQEIIQVDMTDAQRKLYERVKSEVLLDLSDRSISLQSALIRMLRLLQVAEGSFNIDSALNDSGKFDYICQELDNTDEKVVVWSRFQEITNRLYEKYKDRAVLFNGSVSQKLQDLGIWSFQGIKTKEDLEKFNKYLRITPEWKLAPGEAQFFFGVVDPRSSLGINLHANCSRQIFSSFHWNGNAMMQAKGRLTRYGQTADEVRTEYLVAFDTFEKQALSFILKNYQITLEILDGKTDKTHGQMGELVSILRNREKAA